MWKAIGKWVLRVLGRAAVEQAGKKLGAADESRRPAPPPARR